MQDECGGGKGGAWIQWYGRGRRGGAYNGRGGWWIEWHKDENLKVMEDQVGAEEGVTENQLWAIVRPQTAPWVRPRLCNTPTRSSTHSHTARPRTHQHTSTQHAHALINTRPHNTPTHSSTPSHTHTHTMWTDRALRSMQDPAKRARPATHRALGSAHVPATATHRALGSVHVPATRARPCHASRPGERAAPCPTTRERARAGNTHPLTDIPATSLPRPPTRPPTHSTFPTSATQQSEFL